MAYIQFLNGAFSQGGGMLKLKNWAIFLLFSYFSTALHAASNANIPDSDWKQVFSSAKSVVDGPVRKHADALKKAYTSNDSEDPLLKDHSKAEFLDRVVQKLYSMNGGFGYASIRGIFMADVLCWVPPQHRSSQGNPTGKRVLFPSVVFITSDDTNPVARPFWEIMSPEKLWNMYPPEHVFHEGRCVFPRPNAPDYGYVENYDKIGSSNGTGSGTSTNGENTGSGGSDAGGTLPGMATQGVCSATQISPHWKTVDGKCWPSCGNAKNLYCESNDCQGYIVASGDACRNASNKKDLQAYNVSTCCLVNLGGGRATADASSDSNSNAQTAESDSVCKEMCDELNSKEDQLAELWKDYRGRRKKRWLGLRREKSCHNIDLEECESLADQIHKAANKSQLNKRFKKECKRFEGCSQIASEIEKASGELEGLRRNYSKRQCEKCKREVTVSGGGLGSGDGS